MELQINTNSGSESLINSENINIISEEETVTLSTKSLRNTKKELDTIPSAIQNYLKDNNVAIVTFNNIESFQIIQCAYLKKTENVRSKDYIFQFNENQQYYLFITKEENPNYLKQNISKHMRTKSIIKFKTEKEKDEPIKEEKVKNEIDLNFDYNKYLLKLVIMKLPNSKGKTEIFKTDILDREICQISNTTLESINYYKTSKEIKPEKAKKNVDNFNLMLEKYYILEVETKKPMNETTMKEDGILSVLYLMTVSKTVTIKLFTMIKYSLYFIKETLYNYIGKYIHDMIYDFCHLPSDCFSDFLSHIGCLSHGKGSNYNIIFPLKKYIKTLDSLSQKNLISHIYRNLPNIARPKAAIRIPFHKFILMLEKYKQYHSSREYKVKQKYLSIKKYSFLKPSLIFDPINDKITKENKINLNNVLKTFFEILEKFFFENMTSDKNIIINFMIQNLSKFLTQYTSLKGFFNIDIVLNEDNMFEFRCTKNKECNKAINKNMFGCVVGLLGCINYIFGFNEGFFHKHFTIMEYSFNFNEKNIIHTFLSCNDSSTKNKVRIFDIPFMEKWNYKVAGLLLYIYKIKFGFLNDEDDLRKSHNSLNNQHNNFAILFDEINKQISEEVFLYYEEVLPDYYQFCKSISYSPLDKYNCLDNLCQNFANNSVRNLIKNNVIFFNPFEAVYTINQKHLLNYPNLNSILEPYLIMVDEQYKIYLEKKEKKEQYLKEINLDIKQYYKQLKIINVEKVHYSIFMGKDKKDKKLENNIIEIEEEEEFEDNKEDENNNIISTISTDLERESNINNLNDINAIYPEKMHKINLKSVPSEKIPKELFNYYFLLNLYYNYSYITIKELKEFFSNYDIIKRYIASVESSITVSFHDINRTIIKDTKQNKYDVKDIKKKQKKGLIKDLIILHKLTNFTRHMNYIFCQYMNGIIKDIIEDKSSNISYRNELGEKHYLKIGHYIVDFLAYEKQGVNFNSFQYFQKTDIYKKLFGGDNQINNIIEN